jgi:hypothetical protein
MNPLRLVALSLVLTLSACCPAFGPQAPIARTSTATEVTQEGGQPTPTQSGIDLDALIGSAEDIYTLHKDESHIFSEFNYEPSAQEIGRCRSLLPLIQQLRDFPTMSLYCLGDTAGDATTPLVVLLDLEQTRTLANTTGWIIVTIKRETLESLIAEQQSTPTP